MRDRFEFGLDVLKADTREGRPVLTVYATDTAPDKEGERCSAACLEDLIGQARSGAVDLVNTHMDAVGFGRAIDARVMDAAEFDPALAGHKALLVDVELDTEFPHARKLFEMAQDPEERKKIGFSIGGKLDRSKDKCVTYEKGKRVFHALKLDHITAARRGRAANGRTHIAEAVYKSLDMTKDDERALGCTEATVRELAARFNLPLQADGVAKTVSMAYFEGTTEEGGRDGHEHYWSARLNGETGTFMGMTQGPSIGDRHAHMIDLLGDEEMSTSPASRGTGHTHPLGMGNVKQITQDIFEHRIVELAQVDPQMAAKLMEGLEMKQEQPAPAVAEGLDKESVSFLKNFMQAAKNVAFGKEERISDVTALAAHIESLALAIPSDYVEKGGDIDTLAKATVGLLQRVSGVRFDRDSVSVRTAKLYDAIESVSALKVVPDAPKVILPVETPAPAAEAAPAVVTAPATEEPAAPAIAAEVTPAPAAAPAEQTQEPVAPAVAAQETPDMTPEKLEELRKGIVTEVTDNLLGVFRKEGLLPKVVETPAEPAAPAPAVAAPAATEAAPAQEASAPAAEAPAAPAVVPPAETPAAPATAPATVAPKVADESVTKLLEGFESVSKTLSSLSERLAAIEKAPATAPKSMAGQESVKAKKGTFSGVITPKA